MDVEFSLNILCKLKCWSTFSNWQWFTTLLSPCEDDWKNHI